MSFNWFPINTIKNTIGVKPIKLVRINFVLVIFKKDNNKFCKNKGVPGIILKIIKYSVDELDMYLFKLFTYLLINPEIFF